jgi:signal transduction histidine kinase
MQSLLNFNTGSPQALSRAIRYVDWTLVIVGLLLGVINSSYLYSPTINFLSYAFGAAFIVLGCFIPLERPLFERRIYVFINIVFAIVGAAWFAPNDLLLHWAIIKSSFFLSLKEVLLTITFGGILYIIATISSLPIVYEILTNNGIQVPNFSTVILIGNITYYLGACSFSILMSLLVIAERKSRQKAEALAQEIEILAANLERTRIARDIHDSLGHTLTNLQVQLVVAQKLRQRYPRVLTLRLLGA